METIQLQCGSCGQMMGIDTAHLGSQVQCPHCQAVVQTPAPSAPAGQLGAAEAIPAVPQFPAFETGERESIFAQPEPADDLFDAAPPPQIELPPFQATLQAPLQPAPPPQPAPASSYEPTITMEPAPLHEQYAPQQYAPQQYAPQQYAQQEYGPPSHAAVFEQAADNDITPIVPRTLPRRSNFIPILLIFLIPYAICTTGFIGYLLWLQSKYEHPLKTLPDPTKDGASRKIRISYNADLPDDLKVGLGQTLRIGEIEITPHEVKRTPTGDLMLVFRTRNVSEDQVFTPIADQWLRYSGRSMTEPKPYTFLERQTPKKDKDSNKDFNKDSIYGGNLAWLRAGGKNQLTDGELKPGEEAVVQLVTEDKYRPNVRNLMSAPERLLWRVQVRRGLVPFEGKDVSATAVFGVDFTARDIVKDTSDG